MKRKTLIALGLFIGLGVVWIVFNQFDSRLDPDVFTLADIPKASFATDNGFYILWALSESPDVDIEAPKTMAKYRRLFAPGFDHDRLIHDFDWPQYRNSYKMHFQKPYRKLQLDFRNDPLHSDWCADILARQERLLNLHALLEVLLRRYRTMIERPIFDDFIHVQADAPLPNLLAWLHAAKLYTAINMARALTGQWEEGVANLLDQLDFSKKAVRGSRFLIVNLISKAVMMLSTQAINELMNRKECPDRVFELVLARTPPLQPVEYTSRKSFMCEALGFTRHTLKGGYLGMKKLGFFKKFIIGLLLQPNRTENTINAIYSHFIERELTPPYQWKSLPAEIVDFRSGPFWWFRNLGGKLLCDAYGLKNFDGLHAAVFKSYSKKVLYDLMRISAELHLTYRHDRSIPQTLNSLDSFRVLDPCSGQHYRWNDSRQLLYSIGTDGIDNQGETNNYDRIEGTDVALPVILFIHEN